MQSKVDAKQKYKAKMAVITPYMQHEDSYTTIMLCFVMVYFLNELLMKL